MGGVNPIDIMPALIQFQVVNDADKEVILAKSSEPRRGMMELLSIIDNKKEDWFPCLMYALKNNNYEHIVLKITPQLTETGRSASVILSVPINI